jgi:hypothetical protein
MSTENYEGNSAWDCPKSKKGNIIPACRSGTQAGNRELGLGSGYPTRPNEFVQHIGRQPDNVVLAGSGGPLEACGYDKRGIIVETLDKLYYHYIFKISFNKYFE